ncbi:hypothetical protein C8Q74DRAFT_1441246 [Fomes fomentarius]|nr:hypothetical protein C8Q74DRAFT_1441246 [Fomes fomentarius]
MLLRCHILLFALLIEWGRALSVNRTIDNRYGDSVTGQLPLFMPDPWSEGDQCPGCHAQPDPKQCHNGTWSDTTHHDGLDDGRNVTVQFTGTAVYAYHILSPPIIWTDTLTNLSFTLDGTPVPGPNFVWDPPASEQEYQYNVPVYVNESLENTDHTLVIHLVGPVSLGLFDYVVYTFDDGASPSTTTSTNPSPTPTTTVPSPVSHRSLPVGAIVGGSVGGLVLILIVIATVVIHRRERQRSRAALAQRRMTLESSINSEPQAHGPQPRSSFIPEKRDLWTAPDDHSRTSASYPQTPSEPDRRSSYPTSQAVSLLPGHPMPVVPEYPMSEAGYTEASLTSGVTVNFSDLRNEVAVLRDEIVRLRQDEEMVAPEEALPQYESHRGSSGPPY